MKITFNRYVQVYHVSTQGPWRLSSHSLPYPIAGAAVVPFGDTFLIVGGAPDGSLETSHASILEFEPDSETWIEREETLALARRDMFAVMIEDNDDYCIVDP